MRVLRASALGGRVAVEAPAPAVLALLGLSCAVVLLFLGSLMAGRIPLAAGDALSVLVGTPTDRAALVAGEFRLPRALVGLMAGGLLALSGALLQGATRNPLADPALVGVSQGAGLAVVALTVLAPGGAAWTMPAAFAGGLAVAAVILSLSSGQSIRFLLIGVGMAAFLAAMTTAILTYGGLSEAHAALAWLAGSVRASGWGDVRLLAWCSLAALPVAVAASRPLAAMRLGDDLATTLGHRAGRARLALLLAAVAMAAGSVAVVGPIAFIGLLSPHISARLAPAGPGLHLALSWVTGALLTGGADLAGRTLAGPVQVPAGLVAALMGAPLFALLILRKHGSTP